MSWDLGNLALAVLGIVVSLVLFLVGYRQTIGARKERVLSANLAVERILIRRIVHEEYKPTFADVTRLLEGKAQDFRVRVDSLFDETQVLTAAFTRMMETEFIAQQQRDEVLGRLEPALLEAEASVPTEAVMNEPRGETGERRERLSLSVALAVVASLAGSVVALLPNLDDLADRVADVAPVLVGTMAASLAAITAWLTVLRYREAASEVTSRSSAFHDAVRFEQEIFRLIEGAGLNPEFTGAQDRGYDFALPVGGRRVLIELKAWASPPPARVLAIVAERLAEAIKTEQADEGFVVVGGAVPRSIALPDRVRLLTPREFKRALRSAA